MTQSIRTTIDHTMLSGSIPSVEQDLLRASQGLPLLFVHLLERRYLQDLELPAWSIEGRANDHACQILREVLALGKPRHKEEWSAAMPHVLSACHEPGNSLLMSVFHDGSRPHIYLGSRRIIGQGGRNSEDFLKAQEGAFQSFFGGLTLSDPAYALNAADMPEFTEFLREAPAMATVTGIPSRRKTLAGFPFELQSIDQLVKASGQGRYSLIVVAEPVRPEVIDTTIDICRRLISFVHGFSSVTKSRGHNRGTSLSQRVEPNPDTNDPADRLTFLRLASGVLQAALGVAGRAAIGEIDPLNLFSGIATFARAVEELETRQRQDDHSTMTTSSGSNDQISATFIDANAEACEKLLREYSNRLETARSSGWWNTAVYIAAENEAVLANIAGALRSICAGESSSIDHIRVLPLPEHLLREAMIKGRLLTLVPSSGNQRHPFGESYDSLSTCMTSEELSVLVNLPRNELPGIPMREVSQFHLATQTTASADGLERYVEIGTLTDSLDRALSPVHISEVTLNRHLMVTGIPGSGKTNTCWQLLREAWTRLHIPFLVIEPAKAEYKRLADFPEFRDCLTIFSVGGITGTPLRLNIFDWVDGVPLLRHINLLKAIFTASLFPPGQDSPLPFLIEDALCEMYLDRGWDLHTSTNPYLGDNSLRVRSALLPELKDFVAKLRDIIDRRGYQGTVQGNLQAYVVTRLRALSNGIKGLCLNSRRSTPFKLLFEYPAVIELKEAGDEDEKAFMIALVFSLLYEYAEVRVSRLASGDRESLQHLTLIEEAHRLLKSGGAAGKLSADPVQKAVTMFTDMLAEMRAYGEGFIIVDQIPTKLAPETLKNTNLKIVHRLTAADDRRAVGECMNLNELQTRHLNNLKPGMAVMHFEDIGEPILCRVPNLKDQSPVRSESEVLAVNKGVNSSDRIFLHRHGGCAHCPSPCDYFHYIDTAASAHSGSRTKTPSGSKTLDNQPENHETLMKILGNALMPVIAGVLGNREEDATRAFEGWCALTRRQIRSTVSHDDVVNTAVLYCAAAQATNHQFADLLKNRGSAVRDSYVILPQDLVGLELASAAMARLFPRWLGLDKNSFMSPEVFKQARTELVAAMFSEPPEEFRDNPKCTRCSNRCTMLPFVSRSGRDLFRKLPSPMAISQMKEDTRTHVLEAFRTAPATLPDPIQQFIRTIDPKFTAWYFCLSANIEFLKTEDHVLGQSSSIPNESQATSNKDDDQK